MASDIKAGKAFIEISATDSALQKKLAGVGNRLKRWGQSITAIWAPIAAGASAAAGAIGAAAKVFADSGDAIGKLASETGFSAESLSALQHAAQQTDASVEDLATGLRGLNRFTGEVAGGSKAAAKVLSDLGISAGDFLAATPEQRFKMIADGIAGIRDPALRSAAAMDIFGRSGQNLQQLMSMGSEGIDAMTKRAKTLGLVMSEEDVAAAAELDNVMGTLTSQIKEFAVVIGSAVAGPLTTFGKELMIVVGHTLNWMKENRGLVTAVAAVVGVVAAVSTGIVGVGLALTVAGIAVGAIASALAFLLSPLGLAIAGIVALGVAIVGGIIYFAKYTEAGRQMAETVGEALRGLFEYVKTVFGGIVDAIIGGRLDLAMEIAGKGMQVAWQAAMLGMTEMFNGFVSSVMDGLRTLLQRFQALAEKLPGGKGFMTALDAGLKTLGDVGIDTSEMTDNLKALQDDLAKLAAKAAEARAAMIDKLNLPDAAKKAAALFADSGKGTAASGTFNAAVAAMMGQTAVDYSDELLERIAEAAEEIADSKGLAFVD